MKKYNILIVDDSKLNLKVAKNILKKNKTYRLETCSSGLEAIDLLKYTNNKIDLILLDVIMPDIDGFETCKQIRNLGIKTPIIFLTGMEKTKNVVEGFKIGGNDYIKKPFDELILNARIENQLKLQDYSKLQEKLKAREMYDAVIISANHNLRQPLTVIMSSIQVILMDKEKLDNPTIDLLDTALVSVKQASTILDKLDDNKNLKFESYAGDDKMIKIGDD